jgi:hypothetical protein
MLAMVIWVDERVDERMLDLQMSSPSVMVQTRREIP